MTDKRLKTATSLWKDNESSFCCGGQVQGIHVPMRVKILRGHGMTSVFNNSTVLITIVIKN